MKAEIERKADRLIVNAIDERGNTYASFAFPFSDSDIIASAKAGLLASALEGAEGIARSPSRKPSKSKGEVEAEA